MTIRLPYDKEQRASSGYSKWGFSIKSAVFLLTSALTYYLLFGIVSQESVNTDEELCPSTSPLPPKFNNSLETIYKDQAFKLDAIEALSGAIKIPTEISDRPPNPKDDPEFYDEFKKFHKYLKKTFPKVFSTLEVETVNEYALLLTWKGSKKELKPLMLAAHMDVVPVERQTVDKWKFPPFDGIYDDHNDIVWGRGALDCKGMLIAQLVAVEQLIKDGYEPERTLLLSYGFDEESSGALGAFNLNEAIMERYGNDGIYAIVDEGQGVQKVNDGLYIASPVTGEKGYLDLEVTVHGTGGHSSVPPDHTTIGVASQLVTLFEDNPFQPSFDVNNPFFGYLSCLGEHDDDLSIIFRKAILNSPYSSAARAVVTQYVSRDRRVRDLFRTTRAVDIINGGIKANALPEETRFLINHRINIDSSEESVVTENVNLVKQFADKQNYGLILEDKEIIPATDRGYIELKVLKSSSPTPITPTKGSDVWSILKGTIQHVYESQSLLAKDTKLYVTTSLFTGNTDTRHYLGLTKNIFRFFPGIMGEDTFTTIHSVNEHISASSYLTSIGFYYEYIVNTSEQQ